MNNELFDNSRLSKTKIIVDTNNVRWWDWLLNRFSQINKGMSQKRLPSVARICDWFKHCII